MDWGNILIINRKDLKLFRVNFPKQYYSKKEQFLDKNRLVTHSTKARKSEATLKNKNLSKIIYPSLFPINFEWPKMTNIIW